MKIYVQLIENYLKQEIPTIILTIEKQKYIFNMPTCFQRFIKDHRQKFPKGSVIFFTKTSSETLAGLSGFMLTIFESKLCQDTKLYVSDAMYHYLEQVRYKMGFKILPYSYSNLLTNETRTGVKNVDKVYELLQKQNYAQIFMNSEKYIAENLPAGERNESKNFLNQDNEYVDPDVKIIAFEVESNKQKIMNFICIPNKLEGKVLMNKVKEFKIPPKLISKLLAEGTLQLEDGTVVKAEDIKEPDSASPDLLILHYNSIECVGKIAQHPKLVQYLKNPQYRTESVIHIVQNPEEQSIVESKQFAFLISLFPTEIKHILYNRNYRNKDYDMTKEPVSKHIELVSFVNKYFSQSMPDILSQHYEYLQANFKQTKLLEEIFPGKNLIAYKRFYEMILAPKKSQGYFAINDNLNQKQKQKKEYNVPQGVMSPELIQCSVPAEYGGGKGFDPKVVFLGTGSMKPSKYRNVSSIYVEMGDLSALLDCGQGSYYQLFNHFGEGQIDEITLRIKTIFITHIHSDHNLGILDFIGQRNKLLRRKYHKMYKSDEEYSELVKNDKLFLIIPYNVLPWFESYTSNIENLLEGCDVLFVQTLLNQNLELSTATASKDEKITKINRAKSQMKDEAEQDPEQCEQQNQELEAYFSPLMKLLFSKHAPFQPNILNRFEQTLKEAGVLEFTPVHVDHCPQSFGIVMTHKSGVKISYSGDCRPSKQFIQAAHRSTLLIHQATFGDDLLNNAVQNMHTTVGEAIELAIESQSWKLALTHFSQRYISAKEIVDPSLYKLNEKKRNYALNHSIVCFDHLRMRMSELPLLVYQSRKICEIFPTDSLE